MIKNTKIVLGVCGGIAAYKSADLTRRLMEAGAEVHVVMSRSAREFITPLTLQTLSGHPVHTELFDLTQEQEIGHISLADMADLILIAPATANVIAKAAHGLCDDLLSAILLATRAPIVFAPAMNVHMWENKITQENVTRLQSLGYHFIEPACGTLACGYEGKGRLPDPPVILEKIEKILKKK